VGENRVSFCSIPSKFRLRSRLRFAGFIPGRLGFSERGFHTGKEAVQLHENLQVNVVALRSLAVAVAHMVTVQVDT
jgi:hypothetical protein